MPAFVSMRRNSNSVGLEGLVVKLRPSIRSGEARVHCSWKVVVPLLPPQHPARNANRSPTGSAAHAGAAETAASTTSVDALFIPTSSIRPMIHPEGARRLEKRDTDLP